MDPSNPLYALLIALGVSPAQIATGLLILGSMGWTVAHMVAWGWISPPTSSTGLYAKIWPVLNSVAAANYGAATNLASAPAAVAALAPLAGAAQRVAADAKPLAAAAAAALPVVAEAEKAAAGKLPCALLLLGLGAALSGCAASDIAAAFGATATPGETDGQLFCNIAKSDGTSMVVSVVDAALDVPVVVTNIAAFVVDDECGKAAAAVGAAAGAPTPKPADPAVVVTPVAIAAPAQVPAGQTAPVPKPG